MKLHKLVLAGVVASIVFVAAVLLTACTGDVQPAVCATYQAPDGTWMEEDNETVDSDPCDLDDAFEVDNKKKPTPKKTTGTGGGTGGKKKKF